MTIQKLDNTFVFNLVHFWVSSLDSVNLGSNNTKIISGDYLRLRRELLDFINNKIQNHSYMIGRTERDTLSNIHDFILIIPDEITFNERQARTIIAHLIRIITSQMSNNRKLHIKSALKKMESMTHSQYLLKQLKGYIEGYYGTKVIAA